MKTNQIYIAAAVVVVILGALLWNKGDKVKEVSDQTVVTPSSPTSGTGGNTSWFRPSPTPSTGGTQSPKPPAVSPSNPGSVPTVPTTASLNGSTYRMTSYNGAPVGADTKYSLTFTSGAVSARFCNSMNGNYVLDGNLLKVSNFASTMMYCATPSNLMEIENAFASMLNFGAMIYQSGNTIILSTSKGSVMVFTGF